MANECNDCGDPPGPGSIFRWIGKDGTGKEIELCSGCWKVRNGEAAAPLQPLQLPLNKKKSKEKKR